MTANKLITATALLLIISVLVLSSDWYFWKDGESANITYFQQYVGGLGLGASVSPGWGFINYDPRIDFTDETNLWPVPGGYSYAPDRNAAVAVVYEFTETN